MSQDDSRRAVRTEGAPIPLGSYSQGVASAGLLFVSGQVPVDPATKAVPRTLPTRCAGRSTTCPPSRRRQGRLADAVRIGVFLANLDDFPKMDAVYREYFEDLDAGAHDRGGRHTRLRHRDRRRDRSPRG